MLPDYLPNTNEIIIHGLPFNLKTNSNRNYLQSSQASFPPLVSLSFFLSPSLVSNSLFLLHSTSLAQKPNGRLSFDLINIFIIIHNFILGKQSNIYLYLYTKYIYRERDTHTHKTTYKRTRLFRSLCILGPVLGPS